MTCCVETTWAHLERRHQVVKTKYQFHSYASVLRFHRIRFASLSSASGCSRTLRLYVSLESAAAAPNTPGSGACACVSCVFVCAPVWLFSPLPVCGSVCRRAGAAFNINAGRDREASWEKRAGPVHPSRQSMCKGDNESAAPMDVFHRHLAQPQLSGPAGGRSLLQLSSRYCLQAPLYFSSSHRARERVSHWPLTPSALCVKTDEACRHTHTRARARGAASPFYRAAVQLAQKHKGLWGRCSSSSLFSSYSFSSSLSSSSFSSCISSSWEGCSKK